MQYLSYRNLGEKGGPEFTLEEVKAIAGNFLVVDGPNSEGEMFERAGRPSDKFVSPYPNVNSAIAANGGTSVSLNDLSDCSYTQQPGTPAKNAWTLEPLYLDTILFTAESTPNNVERSIYTAPFGFAISSAKTNADDGSSQIFLHEDKGVLIRTPGDAGVLAIEGQFDTTTSQPEIRLFNGSSFTSDTSKNGNYLGFKMPAGVNEDVTWTLPGTDGLSGYVLSTDGAGNLTFTAPPNPAQAVRTYEINYEGTTAYKFIGPGLDGTELNPTIIVNRGDAYIFTNVLGAHPFQLQTVAGTGKSAYTDGVTGDQPISVGSFEWVVPMDAPRTIFYQCTAHTAMAGSIHVLDNSGGGSSGSEYAYTNIAYTVNDAQNLGSATNGTQNASKSSGNSFIDFSETDSNGVDQSSVIDALIAEFDAGTGIAVFYTQADGTKVAWPVESLTPRDWGYRLYTTQTLGILPTDRQDILSFGTPVDGGGGGAVDSVNSQTGVVSLGIQDMDDYELNPAPGSTPITRTTSGQGADVSSGEVGTEFMYISIMHSCTYITCLHTLHVSTHIMSHHTHSMSLHT